MSEQTNTYEIRCDYARRQFVSPCESEQPPKAFDTIGEYALERCVGCKHDGTRRVATKRPVTPEARLTNAAEVLDAWGTVIRMDWGSIDGRTWRGGLATISGYLRGESDSLDPVDVGVCVHGHCAKWVAVEQVQP